jgi:hypothetical protein
VASYIAKILNLGDLNADQEYFNRLSVKSTGLVHFENPQIIGTDLVFEHKSGAAGKRIVIPANTNYYYSGGKKMVTKTLIVTIGGNYYVPKELYKTLISN